ncbi:hypothetical protein CC78DRAFT_571761 [Lojkania enalia]|uniref:Uncharacterized protein n=1 Tax=Lojkania enalia TaxID=147567 RepID=A0A9P4K1A2_9PLEO|nr:hypothetical protein CC78DRAFT_571761 [Didymosphaeria enalia]
MCLETRPAIDTQDTFDLPFHSDSEDDDQAEMEALSEHSSTSPEPEASVSDHSSSRSSETSGSRDQRSSRSGITLPDTRERRTNPETFLLNLNVPTNVAKESAEKRPPHDRLQLLGTVSGMLVLHHSAIITITHLAVLQFLKKTIDSMKNANKAVAISTVRRARVNALTSRGQVSGTLFDLPLSIGLTNSTPSQVVYKFVYDGLIKMGDCGTLVIDKETREVHGHIVADSENTNVAFIVAAEPIMRSIRSSGGLFE